ncbi:hypothetical protein LTR53_007502 [Teratosphaeriaceae sp. CCFEE 6253]|nr:hypothetical protein LTR53_007502 [Teratosphaeriaceae sp. CCFEE 6253]
MGLTRIILAVCLALFAIVAAIPVNATHNDAVQVLAPRGAANIIMETTWEKGKWFRERFTFGALTCDDIAGHFNKEFATLPNKKHRNLKCGLFTFDVSTYNNLYNGKFALACTLQELLSAHGSPEPFCSVPGICCQNWWPTILQGP